MALSFATCFLVAIVFALSSTASAQYVVHEERHGSLDASSFRHRVKPDTILPLRIALKQNAVGEAQAEGWLMAVSDPDSPDFGNYWTQEDVIEAFKPSEDSSTAVRNWLSSNGIDHATVSDNKQWLAFGIPARDAESLLQTEYFETVTANGGVEISCDRYMLPQELREHIDFVKP